MSPRQLQLSSFAALALALSACQCGAPPTCMKDGDCPNIAMPFCSPTSNMCVSCLEDSQCISGLCLPNGMCGACGPDAQCKKGEACSPTTGQCEPGCESDTAGCAPGLFCKPGSATCVECAKDSQCGPGHVCVADHCMPGCSSENPVCPTGQVCDVAMKSCVGCLSSADCKSADRSVCDGASHTCVGCTKDAECPGTAPACDLKSKTCVQCGNDAQCAPGTVCTQGQCTPGCTATHACAGGLTCDTSNGKCVECTSNNDCSGTTPFCAPGFNQCVECLPGALDTCGPGSYCRGDFVCERGCKTGAECPDGVCLPSHSCQTCTTNTQCAAGNVCQNGTCVAACSATNPCGQGQECCGGQCLDLKNDPNNCGACGNSCGAGGTCCNGQCGTLNTNANCGACGNSCGAGTACCSGSCQNIVTPTQCGACGVACGADQFCDGTSCKDQTFPNFCANKKVYVIYDGQPIDDGSANVFASTIKQYCSLSTVITYGPQSNPAWVDQATGALKLGSGSTVVTAGGPWPNKPLKWLETTKKSTKVYFAQNGVDTSWFKRRSDDHIVATMPTSSCTAHKDMFLIELVTDPSSGTLALVGYGVCQSGFGTQAAGYFYANVLLPNRAAYPDGWYIFTWDDKNNDSVPNSGDLFTKVVSGQ